jgi:hypothetical protein
MNDARPFGGESTPMPAPIPRRDGTGTRAVPPTTPGSVSPTSPAPVDSRDPFGESDPNRAFPNSPSSNPERVNRPDLGTPDDEKKPESNDEEVTVPQKPTSESVDKVPTEATGAPLEVNPAIPTEAPPTADPPAEERAPLEEPATEVPLPPGADEPLNKDNQATVAPVVHVARRAIHGRFGNPAIVKTMVPVPAKQLASPTELATIVSRDK